MIGVPVPGVAVRCGRRASRSRRDGLRWVRGARTVAVRTTQKGGRRIQLPARIVDEVVRDPRERGSRLT